MTIRQQISEVQGVADPKAASILRELKNIVEIITGRRGSAIKKLGADASLPGVISKVNELIAQIQEEAKPVAAAQEVTATRLASSLTGALRADAGVVSVGGPTLMTTQATTSGTSVDFTGIPSWTKKITIMFSGVSGSGTSPFLVQIGTGGTPTTSGYISSAGAALNTAQTSSTAGFIQHYVSTAAQVWYGMVILSTLGSDIWVAQGQLASSTNNTNGAGGVTLGGTLDMVRITTVNGTDTFDAGSVNILYE